MNTKKKIVISIIAILTLICGGTVAIHADGKTPSSEDLLSSGRLEADLNNDKIMDVVFDAKDLKDIATSVETGKSSVATSINSYPNTNIELSATFSEIATAIDNLTAVPDVYYYDKATEGPDCERYILIDGSYYPCNEYGEKTSETALSGNISVVTKDDQTPPAEGEIQLVKYEKTEAANLSAGAAGYADKTFVLGSGSDNISYRNHHRIDYGYFKPSDLSWNLFDLGYKPKYLVIHATYRDPNDVTAGGSLDMIYWPDVNTLDNKYVKITDNGFEYCARQWSFTYGNMYYIAVSD